MAMTGGGLGIVGLARYRGHAGDLGRGLGSARALGKMLRATGGAGLSPPG